MADHESLIEQYLALIAAEYERIGFVEDDYRYLGSGGELTEERLAAGLEALRRVPTGIGAAEFFARAGVDWAALKRDVAERAARDDAT